MQAKIFFTAFIVAMVAAMFAFEERQAFPLFVFSMAALASWVCWAITLPPDGHSAVDDLTT